ncbi:phage/plasmid primase, P4 family [Bradyrhizobium sp.]|uniref:phage/plasmid primase, P4 family n=1 Tax=Bradyrhizobium sp. TaxID=376 RepID=UPI0025C430BB|nr:phage/plasmid primase, P4 family [Bradyrhizobium sp.]
MAGAVNISKRRLEPTLSNEAVSEDFAGLAFIEQHGRDLRFCHDSGCWYRWDNQIWRKDKTRLAFQFARELIRSMVEDADDKKRVSVGRAAFADGVEKFAKGDPRVAVSTDFWDNDPWLIGTPNGTVDLRTGHLRPGIREEGITKSTLVAPTSEDCPLWNRFLRETTGDDTDLVIFLKQWCGYSLTGVTREHALVFVYGPGGNGKSVFLNIVTAILNQYASTAAMDTFTASKTDKHTTDMAMLRGARLVTASETEEGRAWAESRIKQMTGGDRITARFMRQNNFTFVPQFKLTVVGNHKPVLRNVDDAARRRFLIVPFDKRPERPDRELERKLMAEAPAIMQWMVEGCLDWQRRGLLKPDSVVAATKDYFSDQDLFVHWLDEDCDCEKGNNNKSETSSELFKSWKEFALTAGHPPGTRQSFNDKMDQEGFKFYRSAKKREFFGIRLKPKATFNAGA